jgi:hypothetical protein
MDINQRALSKADFMLRGAHVVQCLSMLLALKKIICEVLLKE